MSPSPRDDASLDRLLDGTLAPADAPAELADVARLVRVARGPATAEELRTVAAIAASVPTVGAVVPLRDARPRGRRALVRLAIVGGVVLVGATAAAAATGNLPAPVQSAVSSVAGQVGLDLPDGDPAPALVSDPALPGPDVPPEQARPALCAAWAKDGKPKRGVAFDRLEQAAAVDEASVEDYCADVLAPSTGPSVSVGGPDGSTGKPDDTPGTPGGPDGSTGKPDDTPGMPGGPDGSTGKPDDTPGTPGGPDGSTGKPDDAPGTPGGPDGSTGKPADTPGTTVTPPSSGPPSSAGRPDGSGSATEDDKAKDDTAPQP